MSFRPDLRLPRRHAILAISALAWSSSFACAAPAPPTEDLPAGVEQLLPRGKIAAVFEPVFVPASEAEIDDEAWVLGVVVEGQPKAYSLNLLNRHEVVNDQNGNTSFAAVW